MKSLLVLFSFLVIWASAASEFETRIYRIAGIAVSFRQNNQKHLMLSENCFKTGDAPTCEAAQSIHLASLKGISRIEKNGKNPGALICQRTLHGVEVLGVDKKNGEISFCQFKDASSYN